MEGAGSGNDPREEAVITAPTAVPEDESRKRERDRSGDDRERRRHRSRSRERDERHRSRRDDRDRDSRSSRGDRHRSSRRRSRSRSMSPIGVPEGTSKWDIMPGGTSAEQGVVVPFMMRGNPTTVRQSRRLYIGNVPLGAKDDEMLEFFNAAMKAAHLSSNEQPVMSAQTTPERSFAFLEFRTADDASKCMLLDGIVLHNQSLKIRRPKDYVAPTDEPEQQPSTEYIPGIISTTVPDGPNKLFIGGLPTYLQDEQVKELLQSFGMLKGFNLVKEGRTGTSRGYAFFEFVDPQSNGKAIEALNGIAMGDKSLVVQHAQIGSRDMRENTGLLLPPGSMPEGGGALQGIELPADPAAAGPATRILQLLNMVTKEDLVDDEEYNDIVLDIREECASHGKVVSVEVPRPPKPGQPPLYDPGSIGKVLVEFEDVDGAKNAQLALGGRSFASRTVITSFFPEEDYRARRF